MYIFDILLLLSHGYTLYAPKLPTPCIDHYHRCIRLPVHQLIKVYWWIIEGWKTLKNTPDVRPGRSSSIIRSAYNFRYQRTTRKSNSRGERSEGFYTRITCVLAYVNAYKYCFLMRQYIPDFWRASRRYEICEIGHCILARSARARAYAPPQKFINNRHRHAHIFIYLRKQALCAFEMDSRKKNSAYARLHVG